MATRKKKATDLAQPNQANQNMIMASLDEATAGDQEQIIIDEYDSAIDEHENLLQIANHLEQLEADSSEGDMNTQTDLTDAEVTDDSAAPEAIEPVINLDSTLSIQNVVTLYEKLKKAYATYDAIEIDASHVNSVDTATLQLFVALKKDAIKQKKEVDFFQPSPRFVESARLLDLLDILEITHV